MKTARNKMKEATSLLMSLMLVAGLSGNAMAAPATPAGQAVNSAATQPATADAPATGDATPAPVMQPAPAETAPVIPTDLSVMGMYHHADVVVKTVMIGLLLASVVTWALLFSKGAEVFTGKRRMRREFDALSSVRTLDEAAEQAESFAASSISAQMIRDAQNELELSAGSTDNNGIKERTGFRLERRVSAAGRYMGRGNGILATIGAISPFVGLFGTVWGIMNSFIGIAQTQTTNLAVVAPGIAEALLATAVGLVAAIPAVVIYNIFARTITSYRHQVGDVAAQIILLQGRDLDLAASEGNAPRGQTGQLRVG
ncbi:tol-pal system-associated acyl-CoA thioesterase [Rahnella aquatilis]|uniref:Biopolymer transport protein ExbB n=2 Tax=Rahnella sp. (strain Y9602) TaxID=2703885 RepID=A0A0H3FB98_RAHSY|nr:tonB-system energizer ExbB [Rahnella aceris]AFE56858.1 tonB-system energizer ExbB [Rahnella aquatilis HX2]AYA05635.1 biopolymer transporter ExbB [Rahnella aquatilis]MCM2446672.1 tol-pal system-associated acyl-CoA thioesterase [Rahnella sp. CG8]AZP40876.1 tol-pal system-associated acyl-CoA thioesterase [Rahnella aquatilis]